MTTSAFVLILSILLLGGVIATVGDRIGTRVGKARLSLFNLRPRNTAVLITILTGITVSASTLGILFGTSKPLRKGVFELDEIQERLKTARKELEKASEQKTQTESALAKVLAQKTQTEQELAKAVAQKQQIEQELARVRTAQAETQKQTAAEQAAAQKRLDEINQSLRTARTKQAQTAEQLESTQSQLNQVTTNFSQAQAQLKKVSQQASQLRNEIQNLQADREGLIEQRNQVRAQIRQRDQEIAQRDKALANLNQEIAQRDKALLELDQQISERDEVIAQRETRLKQLEREQTVLEREVAILEGYYRSYQALRGGNLALLRGQMLAFGVFRIVDPAVAPKVVDYLLSEANRNAIQATAQGKKSDISQRVVQISQSQVEQLLKQIKDGREYVVRIVSAENYLVGEKQVQVFADVVLNEIVFNAGEVVAATSADPSTMTNQELQQRIDLLIFGSQVRASRAGIVSDRVQISDGRVTNLIRFIEQLKAYNERVDLKAVVLEDTHIAGPLKVKLVAVKDGEVIFST